MERIHIADAADVFDVHGLTLPRLVNDRRIKSCRRGVAGAVYVDRNDLRRAGPSSAPVKVERKQ
jgi:hypothetical protein